MIKFIYLGKKQNFKLASNYVFDKPLNNGDVFELCDEDVVIMRRCIKTMESQGTLGDDKDFMLYSEYVNNKEQKEFDKIGDSTDFENLTKNQIMEILVEKGIKHNPVSKKADLIKLINES